MANKTVMVVDDSATIRKILQRELSAADYEVIPARNGEEALRMLEWADPLPDLITIDIDMPKLNGFELCRRIKEYADSADKQKQMLADIPTIFVSANDCIENREKGYNLGIIDFISKPFPPGKMSASIDNILNSREQFTGMSALVAEDSKVVRNLVSKVLSRHGLMVHEVSNGEQALKIIKKQKFDVDVVITDYIMPGMTGEQLCRTLRGIEALAQVPIVFISTVDKKETVLDFFKAGANDYLTKPFLEEEFSARIVTHLRNRQYVKELEGLNSRLKFQANHDPLTGLHNRGYFQKKFQLLFNQCLHRKNDLCCLLLDLDYFKKVNDNFGHAFGDLVLQNFSRILSQVKRSADIAARYGGEEFVLVMPDTSLEKAVTLARTLLSEIENFVHKQGETALQVTISSGLASLGDHKPKNPDKLLSMADEALYLAKANGRNRVEIYST